MVVTYSLMIHSLEHSCEPRYRDIEIWWVLAAKM